MTHLCEVAVATGVGEAEAFPTVSFIPTAVALGTAIVVLGLGIPLEAEAVAEASTDSYVFALAESAGTGTDQLVISGGYSISLSLRATAKDNVVVGSGLDLSAEGLGYSVEDISAAFTHVSTVGLGNDGYSLSVSARYSDVAYGTDSYSALVISSLESEALGSAGYTAVLLRDAGLSSEGVAKSSAELIFDASDVVSSVGVGSASCGVYTDMSIAIGSVALGSDFYDLGGGSAAEYGLALFPLSGAASLLSGLPFNSVVHVNGVPYGVGASGVHKIGGGLDNGDIIPAHLDTGFRDLGSSKRKRVSDLYVSGITSGTAALSAFTDEGDLQAADYVLADRGGNSPRTERFKVGRGVSGVYWRLKLDNIDCTKLSIVSMDALSGASNRSIR